MLNSNFHTKMPKIPGTTNTVEPRISGTPNSGKSRISVQFLNDQLFIRYRMNDQISGKSRNSGKFLSDQRFH